MSDHYVTREALTDAEFTRAMAAAGFRRHPTMIDPGPDGRFPIISDRTGLDFNYVWCSSFVSPLDGKQHFAFTTYGSNVLGDLYDELDIAHEHDPEYDEVTTGRRFDEEAHSEDQPAPVFMWVLFDRATGKCWNPNTGWVEAPDAMRYTDAEKAKVETLPQPPAYEFRRSPVFTTDGWVYPEGW